MSPLRVGLLGLDGVGLVYLDTLRTNAAFTLVAIADGNAERVRRACEDSDATVFEDCRSLVVAQTRDPIDALFVTLPPHQSLELLPLAAERGVPVFHHTPFVRSTDEGQHLVQLFEAANCPFVAARTWQAHPPGQASQTLLDRTGRLFAAHARVQSRQTVANWRGDAQRAGGGALLHAGYEAVDAMVTILGLPESVYAECGSATPPGSPKGHDTEDVATVTFRFSRGEIGSLAVWRGSEEETWELTLVGSDGTATLRQSSGQEAPADACLARAVRHCVETFGHELQGGMAQSGMSTPARGHIATLATIDAAYLSAKTGSAEVPAQFMPEPARS